MTKLIVDLKSLIMLDEYKVDGFIINDPDFSCFNDQTLDLEQISQAVSLIHARKKLVFINVDRIIEEDEVANLYQRLNWYLLLDIDYIIYGDYAIFSFWKQKAKQTKLLYNPKTLITNSFDAKFYAEMEQLVMLSNELMFDEIKTISGVGNGVVEVYGYHQIFYSRRLLLSTYQKYSNNPNALNNKRWGLKEEFRSDVYSIYEAEKGTFIYNPQRYCLFLELEDLKNELRFIKISGLFIDEKQLVKIVNQYHLGLFTSFSQTSFDELKVIHPMLSTGYLYKKKPTKEQDYD
ncbi:MAG: peptidase U32 family protein [Bacilli bacterium]